MFGICRVHALTLLGPPTRLPSAADWRGARDEFLFHVIGGAEQKLFGGFVVFVNRSAVGAAQLDRMGDDSRQHGFEVESGADYLADFAERFELAYRACQFVGSLI